MKRTPHWISKKALILLHEEAIAMFGGMPGIRDEGLLESALARPQHLQVYRPECSLAELAAAYAVGLAKNHAFVDGNKRAAFLALGLFLAINGKKLRADPAAAVEVMLAVAQSALEESALASWIEAHWAPQG